MRDSGPEIGNQQLIDAQSVLEGHCFMTFLHGPQECQDFITYKPIPFSHKRYLKIQTLKVLNKRRTNTPFISSESIARLASIKIMNRKQMENSKNRELVGAKSIFVKSELLESFLSGPAQKVNDCVLLTGHSDRNFSQLPNLPNNFKYWFCQNSVGSDDERIFTLPIGIENLSLGRLGQKKFYRVKPNSVQFANKVLVPPMSNTNPIRRLSIIYCKTNPIYSVHDQMLPESQYFELLDKFQFVLCLEGNGFDTHRLWETLYLGKFPVLIESNWSKSLKYLKLPILYIESLEHLKEVDLLNFRESYAQYSSGSMRQLWTPFWREICEGSFDDFLNIGSK